MTGPIRDEPIRWTGKAPNEIQRHCVVFYRCSNASESCDSNRTFGLIIVKFTLCLVPAPVKTSLGEPVKRAPVNAYVSISLTVRFGLGEFRRRRNPCFSKSRSHQRGASGQHDDSVSHTCATCANSTVQYPGSGPILIQR